MTNSSEALPRISIPAKYETEDERQHKSGIHADENLQENCQAEMVNGEKSLQPFLTRVNRTFLGEV